MCGFDNSQRPLCWSEFMADAELGGSADAGNLGGAREMEARQNLRILVIGALGVVYGDIGTSPIYAFREALHASSGGGLATREDVFGVLSLIVWALTVVVTIKYVIFVLRADNRGEGGILSLMALARGSYPKRSGLILALGICGASLFFGDALITPAISVLSAVEGLKVVTPAFDPYVVPITLVILLALFSVQRFGTGKVAIVFGPITAVWFLALGVIGVLHIADDPAVLLAINPYYAVIYLLHQPDIAFLTVGAVFLAVTGAEALYADLGHFGRKPIVLAWLAIVFPSLPPQLFRAGSFRAGPWWPAAEPFLPNGAFLGSGPDGAFGHRRHGDRKSGRDFRRLLACAASLPTQHPAAVRNPAHV
jgi:K+ transporter